MVARNSKLIKFEKHMVGFLAEFSHPVSIPHPCGSTLKWAFNERLVDKFFQVLNDEQVCVSDEMKTKILTLSGRRFQNKEETVE